MVYVYLIQGVAACNWETEHVHFEINLKRTVSGRCHSFWKTFLM